jgi:hypothetical protein
VSDTTDLMGARTDAAPASDASAPATGAAAPKRRRAGTGLEGMVLAELQQLASGLGIKGTARLRKSQLIDTIKAAQGGSAAPAAKATAATATASAPAAGEAAEKPKRRATSRARTLGTPEAEVKAEAKAVAPEQPKQIEIPEQPKTAEKAVAKAAEKAVLDVEELEADLGLFHAAYGRLVDAQGAGGLFRGEAGLLAQVLEPLAEHDLADGRSGPRFTHALCPSGFVAAPVVLCSFPEVCHGWDAGHILQAGFCNLQSVSCHPVHTEGIVGA